MNKSQNTQNHRFLEGFGFSRACCELGNENRSKVRPDSKLPIAGVVHIRSGGSTWIFAENRFTFALGEGVDLIRGGYRCHFWAFQLELNRLGSKNFAIGSVVAKLQSIVFGEILENFEKFKPKINGNPPNVFKL